jgi:hypothetical protein
VNLLFKHYYLWKDNFLLLVDVADRYGKTSSSAFKITAATAIALRRGLYFIFVLTPNLPLLHKLCMI